MTIKNRLTLWHFTVMLSILLSLSIATYFGMKKLLFLDMDEELDAIIDNVITYYNAETKKFEILDKPTFHMNKNLENIHLVVINAQGDTVFYSPISSVISLNIPRAEEVLERVLIIRRLAREMPLLPPDVDEEISFRAHSRKVMMNNRLAGWVHIAVPMEDIEESLQKLLLLLFGLSLSMVVASGIGSYFITRESLLPLQEIAEKARKIGRTNLMERIEVYNPNDELGQISMLLNDLLNRLQMAFESQQQFLADAAHELRTPLAILRAHWEDELNNPELTLSMKEKLVKDLETISRLSYLINNLLMLSQTEAAGIHFERVPLHLDELLQEVVADTGLMAETRAQSIRLSGFQKVLVEGDKVRLYQLFFNIIDNAVKYTQDEGEIHISLEANEGKALVRVRDNGPGIPEDDLPKIFRRFYRVHKDRSRKTGGSGLGLAICRLIAKAHDGQIEVESRIGKGTTFIITLPMKALTA